MEDYLTRRRLPYYVAVDNGWYVSTRAGDEVPRIVMPATASDPTNRYWQARRMDDDPTLRYTSPAASRGDAVIVVWPKPRAKGAVVVEGPMDALAAAGAGHVGFALMGALPPEKAITFLAVLARPFALRLVLDQDAPDAMIRVLRMLVERGVVGTLVSPYPYKDLAEAPPAFREGILA